VGFSLELRLARANETFRADSAFSFNNTQRKYVAGSGRDQGSSLGWEMDYGTSFQWDDSMQFGLDFGLFFPGEYFRFSNTATDNATDTVFAMVARVGVSF